MAIQWLGARNLVSELPVRFHTTSMRRRERFIYIRTDEQQQNGGDNNTDGPNQPRPVKVARVNEREKENKKKDPCWVLRRGRGKSQTPTYTFSVLHERHEGEAEHTRVRVPYFLTREMEKRLELLENFHHMMRRSTVR